MLNVFTATAGLEPTTENAPTRTPHRTADPLLFFADDITIMITGSEQFLRVNLDRHRHLPQRQEASSSRAPISPPELDMHAGDPINPVGWLKNKNTSDTSHGHGPAEDVIAGNELLAMSTTATH